MPAPPPASPWPVDDNPRPSHRVVRSTHSQDGGCVHGPYAWLDTALQEEREALADMHQTLLRNFATQFPDGLFHEHLRSRPSSPAPTLTSRPITPSTMNGDAPFKPSVADAFPARVPIQYEGDNQRPFVEQTSINGDVNLESRQESPPPSPLPQRHPCPGSEPSSPTTSRPSEKKPPDRSRERKSSYGSEKPSLKFVAERQVNLDCKNGVVEFMAVLVQHPKFDFVIAVLIGINSLLIALEQQYKGIEAGYTLGYPQYLSGADETWPWAATFFSVSEFVFGIFFTLEVCLKLVGLRRNFAEDWWNFIDTAIVVAWFVGQWSEASLPVNPVVLRLARLMRLLRLLKLVKTIKEFDSLYLMTEAIKGSLHVLLWTVIVLTLVQMLIACILQQILAGYFTDPSEPEASRREVFRFYGTFARTMLTMFEITLGNWMPPCRALVENVSEFFMFFSLFHKLVIGYSVVSVITGVFIQETFKVATTDDQIMLNQKERTIRTHTQKMEALFKHADTSGDGFLDIAEFMDVVSDARVKKWLSSMELDVRDARKLWELMATGGEQLSAPQLVQGASRLKGAAKSIDLMGLIAEVRGDRAMLQQIYQEIVTSKRCCQ